MRIAYIAPYQGPTLLKRRPIKTNLSLGARVKVELIAELLQGSSHTVEIISQGEVVEREWKYYPDCAEAELFNSKVPIWYSSAFPARFVNGLWSSFSTLARLKSRHAVAPFDLVIVYNLKPPQVRCANYVIEHLELPVVLEYEDDAFLEIYAPHGTRFTANLRRQAVKRLLATVSGCIAGSDILLSQVPATVPKLLLPGVVSPAISNGARRLDVGRKNWVVFSGTHSLFQGLEQLIEAWRIAKVPGWELHIAGKGEITGKLQELAGSNSSIVFHGVLNREQNAELLGRGKITVVAYEISKANGFSFKTIECLGAGMHVITTRLTALESLEAELKAGLSYIEDNKPETIAACLKKVIVERRYECTVQQATLDRYGPAAVSQSLEAFLKNVLLTKKRDERFVMAAHVD